MTLANENHPPLNDGHWTEGLRSSVRPLITYAVIGTYITVAGFASIYLLMQPENIDNALALIGGLSGVAAGIVGFWFGSRGVGGVRQTSQSDSAGSGQSAATDGDTAAQVSQPNEKMALTSPAIVELKTPISLQQVQELGQRNGQPVAVTAFDIKNKTLLLNGRCEAAEGGGLKFTFTSLDRTGRPQKPLQPAFVGQIGAPDKDIAIGRKVSITKMK